MSGIVHVRLGDTNVAVNFELAQRFRDELTRFLFCPLTPPGRIDATLDVIAIEGDPSRIDPPGRRVAKGEGWAFWYDERDRSGTAFFDSRQPLPVWHVACPFRQMFAWMALVRETVLVHAAAVRSIHGGGVLFVGPGGAGKSTLARAVVRSSVRYQPLGDDWVAVASGHVSRVYGSVKLTPFMFGYLGDSAQWHGPLLERGEKVVYEGSPPGRDAFASDDYPIQAIIVPKIAESGVAVRSITSQEALFKMAPSTLLQSQGVDGRVLKAMVGLCNHHPCYELAVSQKMLPAAGAIVKELING